MLVSAAITHIRNRTGHDVDGQVNDSTMLLPWVEQEARRVRRELSLKVPQPFTKLSPIITVLSGEVIELTSVSDQFERLVQVDKRTSGNVASSTLPGNTWCELPVYEDNSPWLGYREEGAYMRFYPESLAPGSYRVRYIVGLDPAAFTVNTNLNGTPSESVVGLPQGMEEVVIERVCAIVATRVPGDDPGPHRAEAERIWSAELSAFRRRYGSSPKPGFKRVARIG